MEKLSAKQIAVLRELAEREEKHGLLARALLDERHAALQHEQNLRTEIARLTSLRSAQGAIARNAEARIAELRAQLERVAATNSRRGEEAEQRVALSNSLRATIDAVLRAAGTTRSQLGLDFYRSDSQPATYLTRTL